MIKSCSELTPLKIVMQVMVYFSYSTRHITCLQGDIDRPGVARQRSGRVFPAARGGTWSATAAAAAAAAAAVNRIRPSAAAAAPVNFWRVSR